MLARKEYVVITFHTTAEAIAMEKKCGAQGIPGRIIPVPTEISAGCGLAWRMKPEEYEEWKHVLGQNGYQAVSRLRL